MKNEKTTWVFLYIKYSKFWSVSLEHFVERKPPISEECYTDIKIIFLSFLIERYLGLCHPLLSPHSRKAWFYIIPVVIMALVLNSPKFFEIEINYETDRSTNETYPTYRPTKLRTNEHYIKGYQMWTRLFSTALIPVASLLFLNIQIMNDILSSSKKTQRYIIYNIINIMKRDCKYCLHIKKF